MPESQRSEVSPQLGVLLAFAPIGITLIAVWLYVTGWTYAYYYFAHYNIGLVLLAIPRDFFFVYGVWVVRSKFLWLLGAIIVIIIFIFCSKIILSDKKYTFIYLPGFVVFMIMVFFLFGYMLGVSTSSMDYMEDRENDFPHHPRVRVILEEAGVEEELAAELARGCHRVLFQNTNLAFLFLAHRGLSPRRPPSLLVLSRSKIATFQVLPHYRSCG